MVTAPASSVLSDFAPPAHAESKRARTLSAEALHPALWLGHQLGHRVDVATSSGFAQLDAELPGYGWPSRGLTEILLPPPGLGEIRLLAPVLGAAQPAHVVMLFDPPLRLEAAALDLLGVDAEHLLVITTQAQTSRGNDSLWALEQAIKSGHVGAILAWLPPRLRSEKVKRLQLAAHNHDGVAFMVRHSAVRDHPSAAPLRLELGAAGGDRLRIRVLKRRGPPLLEPLTIELPGVLSAAARRRSNPDRLGSSTVPRVPSLTQ